MIKINIFTKTLIVTTVVFVLGLGTGLLISREQSTQFEQNLVGLTNSVEDAELQFLFLDTMGGNISCTYLVKEAGRLAKQTEKMADDVDSYERTQQISNTKFMELKSKYTAVLIRDWLILEKIKQTCNGTYTTVLYFYSNKNCGTCLDQGIALSFFKLKMGEKLMIFAIDQDIELNIVSGLQEAYGITAPPGLVINGKVYPGYSNTEKLKTLLCPYAPETEICKG